MSNSCATLAGRRVVFPIVGTGVGGSIVSTALLADALARRTQVEPRVVLPPRAVSAELFRARDVPVDELDVPEWVVLRLRRVGGFRRYARAVPALTRTYREARRYLRAARPDLVHVGDDAGLLPWGYAARRAGIPVIWHVHQERRSRVLDRTRLRLTDHVLFVSDANRIRFAGRRLPRSTRVHNWVDPRDASAPTERAAAKRRHGFDPELPLVGFVGNLVRRKRPEWVVQAVRDLRAEGRAVGAVLVGQDFSGGAYTRRLRASIAEAGLEGAVHLLGYRSDVAELLPAFDVLALTSVPSGEAFPRSVIEAMAAGVPVVATDVAGVSEAVEHGVSGLLCDPNDHADLVAKLSAVLDDAELRRRFEREGLRRARASFSEEVGLQRTSRVYAELLQGR